MPRELNCCGTGRKNVSIQKIYNDGSFWPQGSVGVGSQQSWQVTPFRALIKSSDPAFRSWSYISLLWKKQADAAATAGVATLAVAYIGPGWGRGGGGGGCWQLFNWRKDGRKTEERRSTHEVVANVQDCNIVVNDFEL